MSDYLPLGKPLRQPAAAPTPDEYERFTGSHGDRLMRNKRTGAIESATPKKIVVPEEPIAQPEVTYIPWAAVCRLLALQQASGFPLNEFGSL